jgi:DNA-binding beta-propeller fold protein YncE
VLIGTLVAAWPASAQTARKIKYGDVVNGPEIRTGSSTVAYAYTFDAKRGDKVTILMSRRTGNLRPLVGIVDPSKPQNQQVLVASGPPVANGTIAGIANFTIPATKTYTIIATRENASRGTTRGQFRLFLLKGGVPTPTIAPDDEPTEDVGEPEETPTRRATATRRRTATPTEESVEDPTEEPTEEPTEVVDEPSETPTRRPTSTRRPSATPTPGAEEPTEEPTEEVTPEATAEATKEATVAATAVASAPNEAVRTFNVGKQPIFSLWTGSSLFVSNFADGTISVLDDAGKVVSTIDLGGAPFAMAWDGQRVWVADIGTGDKPGDSVHLFNAAGKKADTFKVGAGPFSLSYDAGKKRMWIALFNDKKIVAVDSKGKILTTIETDTNPNTVLWTGDKLWATLAGDADNVGDTVIAIDTSGEIKGTFKVGKSPADLAWNDTDGILYVANTNDGTITALDADGKVIDTYNVGKEPVALVWDGSHLWVSLGGESAVVALDAKGKELTKIPVTGAPNGISFDGTNIWVANQGTAEKPGSTMTRINVESALAAK